MSSNNRRCPSAKVFGMPLIATALAIWCVLSVLAGLALGRLLHEHEIPLPECPPDARALTEADEPTSTLATR